MNNLNGSKFLITGGAGFIGSHIVDELVKEDVKSIVIYDNLYLNDTSNLDKAFDDHRVTLVKRDILDHLTLDYIMYNSDYVFHFANVNTIECKKSPEMGLMTNIIGTFNILRSAIKNKVKKIIYPSSMVSQFKNTFHDATKLFCEKALNSFYEEYHLNCVSIKYGNIYGERDNSKLFLNNIIDNIIDGKDITIYKDNFEYLLYVTDAAKIAIEAMKLDIDDKNLNICGNSVSISEVEKILHNLFGVYVSTMFSDNLNFDSIKDDISKLNMSYDTNFELGIQKLYNYRKKLKS